MYDAPAAYLRSTVGSIPLWKEYSMKTIPATGGPGATASPTPILTFNIAADIWGE